MQYVARKIHRSLWEERLQVDLDDVAADAVTNDLRTQGHTLSVWECGATEDEMSEVALALACTMKGADSIDLVLLDADVLALAGVPMRKTPAKTPVTDLNDRHADIAELTLTRLGVIARHIAEKVRSDIGCREFRQKEVQDIVFRAVDAKRVRVDSLKAEWQEEIRSLRDLA